ncbi:MAG: tryptophan synthase subunit beta [Bdellovibrionaceae bacterium]|nr:tryptophan synthase subunit beta [Pseudobdellovibrionaceae bacterium]
MTGLPLSNSHGRFGKFGGQYVPETLIQPLVDLERAFFLAQSDVEFKKEFASLLADFVGRETPLYLAERLSQAFGKNIKIYLKREDLAHTGAHKINNALGQVLLAKKMGKTRIIAETGAGQHGVATAAAAARYGMKCVVYMGADDIARQGPNVRRMRIFGAEVKAVTTGSRTLKDAVSEAMRDWVTQVDSSAYVLGSALGPHPYPLMVREFQSVIGDEARRQILAKEGRLPDEVIACVGGGSNAIGIFQAFLQDESVALTGVEAGGSGKALGRHAARFQGGCPGVFQGTATYVLQDQDGQIASTQSISAGLDYAAVGPEHSDLFERGRVQYLSVGDQEALAAFHALSQLEGILPALESSHALAYALQRAGQLPANSIVIVNLSGRGDKDLDIVEAASQGEK